VDSIRTFLDSRQHNLRSPRIILCYPCSGITQGKVAGFRETDEARLGHDISAAGWMCGTPKTSAMGAAVLPATTVLSANLSARTFSLLARTARTELHTIIKTQRARDRRPAAPRPADEFAAEQPCAVAPGSTCTASRRTNWSTAAKR
jgi:hypothetical protein